MSTAVDGKSTADGHTAGIHIFEQQALSSRHEAIDKSMIIVHCVECRLRVYSTFNDGQMT
eukprot:scaffold66480_cov31-Prasinocladus_malaysianus.AAC.1